MKRIKKQIFWKASIVIASLVVAIVGFACDAMILFGIGAAFAVCFIDDLRASWLRYKRYQKVTAQIKNKTIDEKINLICENVESWSRYASKEDVEELEKLAAVMSSRHEMSAKLDYILEYIKIYQK